MRELTNLNEKTGPNQNLKVIAGPHPKPFSIKFFCVSIGAAKFAIETSQANDALQLLQELVFALRRWLTWINTEINKSQSAVPRVMARGRSLLQCAALYTRAAAETSALCV
jgi:hypothetical protein